MLTGYRTYISLGLFVVMTILKALGYVSDDSGNLGQSLAVASSLGFMRASIAAPRTIVEEKYAKS